MNKKTVFWFFLASLILILIYLLAPILMPFLTASLIAYLCDPLVDRLEEHRFSRTVAVTSVFIFTSIAILLLFLLLIPIFETQVRRFLVVLPNYIDWALTMLVPFLIDNFAIDPNVLEVEKLKKIISSNWKETGGVIRNAISAISQSGFVVLGWLVNLALIPLLTFYLLRDWDHLVAYIRDLLPRSIEPIVTQLARESDEVLSAFLRGQLLVMLGLGIIYSLGLTLIGLEFALLIGIIAGLVSFVPYLGLIVGISIASLAMVFQTQHTGDLLGIFMVFGVAQMMEGMILTPLLVGERIGLHPVTVIFAVLAGGQLFGFIGILLALPIAAIIAVVMRHLRLSYKKSHIYRLDIET